MFPMCACVFILTCLFCFIDSSLDSLSALLFQKKFQKHKSDPASKAAQRAAKHAPADDAGSSKKTFALYDPVNLLTVANVRRLLF
jgi:hypothetical protein